MYQHFFELNRKSWNSRTSIHVNADFYDNKSFLEGRNSLKHIELGLLGDVHGKSILHLQCHFGQDSISLSRMGAKVTGVDFSEESIKTANQLAKELNVNTQFICCNIYDLPKYLNKKFDLVFTSYGVIGWLPDMNQWGNIISKFLKPNGRLIMVEFHPVVWMFDDDFSAIDYPYFNVKPFFEEENGTYADRNANVKQEFVMWNHSMSEVVNSLIKNGINILSLEEYNYSPYNCFKHCKRIDIEKFIIDRHQEKIPMTYSIVGKKQ